jgi:hypothetical protein
MLERNEPTSASGAYRVAFRQWPAIATAVLIMLVVIVPLTLIVIGIPIAIWLGVRWFFIPQAVMLDSQRNRGALRGSSKVVGGGYRWFRVAGIGAFLTIVGAAPGPLVGIVCLIIGSSTVDFANGASSFVYAAFLPFSILGFTILYRDLRAPLPTSPPVLEADSQLAGEPPMMPSRAG